MDLWPTYYLPVLRDDHTFRGRYYDAFRDFWRPSFTSRLSELQDWNDQWGRLHNDVWDLFPALELAAAANSPRPINAMEFSDPKQCFIHEPDGTPRFQVQFNAKNFKPEDITVCTQGNQLVVSARHEETKDNMTEQREFNRRIDLPPGVLPETLTTSLSSDGVLSVSAPVERPQLNEPGSVRDESPDGQPQLDSAVIVKSAAAPPPSEAAAAAAVAAAAAAAAPATAGGGSGRCAYFAFQLPVRGFYPEEIKVQTEGRTLTLSGAHTERRGGLESKYSFTKSYLLPPTVDKEKLNAYLKDGRRVVVEAPIIDSGQSEPTVRVLPVEHKQ